jgi:hypothetical protein
MSRSRNDFRRGAAFTLAYLAAFKESLLRESNLLFPKGLENLKSFRLLTGALETRSDATDSVLIATSLFALERRRRPLWDDRDLLRFLVDIDEPSSYAPLSSSFSSQIASSSSALGLSDVISNLKIA